MLRLKNYKTKEDDSFLALPEAEPVTLIQVEPDSLPYACQCPLCGGIFDIPRGILYKIDDEDEDINSDLEFQGTDGERPPAGDKGFFGGSDDDFSGDEE